MLKLGCTLPISANIRLHKSTVSKFQPFSESDKDLLEKIREDMVGGPSIVLTRKAVVHETFIRKSTNLCKSFVGIHASQLYPYSMCQPMLLDCIQAGTMTLNLKKYCLDRTKHALAKIWSFAFFQKTCPECEIESNVTNGRQKKTDCFSVDGVCNHCNTVFEAVGCYFHYCPYQEARPPLTDNEIMRGIKKREQDQMHKE